MSQYQRMISYLYRYEEDVKKNNIGYARIELRGDSCRITVQMRDSLSELPEVAFFRQESQGIRQIAAARLKKNGNGFGCRIETRVDNMANSGYSFSDMDGLIIYIKESLYYATTWKDITVHMGQKSFDGERLEAAQDRAESFGAEEMPRDGAESSEAKENPQDREENFRAEEMPRDGAENFEAEETPRDRAKSFEAEERLQDMTEGNGIGERWQVGVESSGIGEWEQSRPESSKGETADSSAESVGEKETDTVAACQCEACRQCPQRGRLGDIGHHILTMFPRMYPFEIESMKECVRLELKDIGCLPVPYWSLSGNPFLLHGYYCYRHILFAKVSSGDYFIGVPGIYNQENERQARSCGFQDFKSLSEVTDRRGAFGYWLFPVRI